MYITNRTEKVYTWAVWRPGGSILGCEWTNVGQTHPLEVPQNGFKLYYWPGQWNSAEMDKFATSAYFISNPNAKILIQADFGPGGYIDWDAVEQKYIKGRAPSASVTMSMSQGANVAGATIKAVSEVIKMIPIIGSLISGLLNITANIIDAAVKGTAGAPSQVDIGKFVDAVREVVQDESAKDAASTFLNANSYLASLDPGDLGPHELKDLSNNTEAFCAPGGTPLNYLTTMNLDADKAKHITSAYLLGISAYLRFLWFHFLIAVYDGDKITANKLKRVRDSIQQCLDGVTKLRSLAASAVEPTVKSIPIRLEPELLQLRQALYTNFLGGPDVTVLDAAITDLQGVVNVLNEDMDLAAQGKRIKYFFKTSWELPTPYAQPVPERPGPGRPRSPLPGPDS
jgi:hypothetical protein